MIRQLGRASLVGGVASWALLFAALLGGGLDPSASQVPLARAATGSALVIAVSTSVAAIVALARGPQRVQGALGLGLALLFLLVFTGAIFAVLD